jgi:S-adenosylmethionine:tRNA ribosyltransferase-isomerase
MKTADFNYALPPELIAQYPCEERDACRLLHLSRKAGTVSDYCFRDLPGLLSPGDRLVFNNTKVIPARLFCKKDTGGKVELLLTEPASAGSWKALVRPGRGLAAGTRIYIRAAEDVLVEVVAVHQDGTREVSLVRNAAVKDLSEAVSRYGVMALPHYIKRPAGPEDSTAYQTVFAQREGAIASPTAGLHFTPRLLETLAAKGLDTSRVTLHVGIGTFRPVTVDDPGEHVMHEETYELTEETAGEIESTKKRGGKIVAVGTTVVRVLEHCSGEDGVLRPSRGRTRLKILPGYDFKVVDAMVTNFHVPKSTLLMLVSAFAGRDRVLGAYDHAVRQRYRFFSYGDAMLIS